MSPHISVLLNLNTIWSHHRFFTYFCFFQLYNFQPNSNWCDSLFKLDPCQKVPRTVRYKGQMPWFFLCVEYEVSNRHFVIFGLRTIKIRVFFILPQRSQKEEVRCDKKGWSSKGQGSSCDVNEWQRRGTLLPGIITLVYVPCNNSVLLQFLNVYFKIHNITPR